MVWGSGHPNSSPYSDASQEPPGLTVLMGFIQPSQEMLMLYETKLEVPHITKSHLL